MYSPYLFRRRFAVPKALYKKLREDLLNYNPAFWERRKCGFGKWGHTTDARLLAVLRMLSSGCPADSLDDAVYMSEQSINESFRQFCKDVIGMYSSEFLNRRPTKKEMSDVEHAYNNRGFPGCIGSLDCMKLYWKNCPFYDKGQYKNSKESKLATIVCEAWCDSQLYCWHWFPGRAGTNNDITVLYSSALFRDIMNKYFIIESTDSYKILPAGIDRKLYYILVGGIYPDWPFLVKPIHGAQSDEDSFFSKAQEGRRKDVERLFGVLQSRFEILRREIRKWDLIDIIDISNTCVILHNLIVRMQQEGLFDAELEWGENVVIELIQMVDNERNQSKLSQQEYQQNIVLADARMSTNPEQQIDELLLRELQMTDTDAHHQLMAELITHVNRHRQLHEIRF